MNQFYSFVRKEFYHIFRDSRTMLILLVMPIVLIALFGYAVTTEMRNCRVCVVDLSNDEATQALTQRIAANKYFTLTTAKQNYNDVERLFHEGKIDAAVLFSENFSSEMLHSGSASIQILTDGSEPNQASMRTAYISQIIMQYKQDMMSKKGINIPLRINTQTKMLYNPQQKSEYNFVPGVIGMILLLICAMMTSIAIVKEKEMGTMEILLASPLPPITIILAKLVPYFIISSVNLITILLLSVYVLGMPIAGSLTAIMLISMIYVMVALALGLLISSLVDTQMAAMLISLLLIVPTIYLSGLAFPIESMPSFFQYFSGIVPARWFVDAMRKLMIQGVEVQYVMKDTVILLIMAVILITVSVKKFKTRLE